MPNHLSVLGSTGSIGRSTLQVASHLGMNIRGLVAKSNVELLLKQIEEFNPKVVALFDEEAASRLQEIKPSLKVLSGIEGVCEVAGESGSDYVMSAIVGFNGILPTMEALRQKKRIGLANKESLIAAGEIMMSACHDEDSLIPVDSEHSAIFQCLQGEKYKSIRRVILTASGGPFLNHTEKQLESVTIEEALAHPNWDMGKKVTTDCSTLMNKGLEVIEAYHLFGLKTDQIEVVVHPQSIIHSMVEFDDGSIIAQLGNPDMRLPIQYALTYPERKEGVTPFFNFQTYSKLEFIPPDFKRFPCLKLAFEALKAGGSAPCFLNAANESIVNQFLEGRLPWREIAPRLQELMQQHKIRPLKNIEDVALCNREAQELSNIMEEVQI